MLKRTVSQGVLAVSVMFGGAAAGPPAGAAEPIALRIEVIGPAGLPVATNRTTIEHDAARYALVGDTETRGLAGLFANLKTHSEIRGRLSAAGAEPDLYTADNHSAGGNRHERIDFHAHMAVGSSSAASPGERATPGAHGTVDPLTAYFLLERQLGRGGGCSLTAPVFDGRYCTA